MTSVDDTAPSWGIEPVPDRLRVLGLLDTGLLWSNLGVSLLVIVAAPALVPALSLPEACLAILIGGVIGNVMLGVAGDCSEAARTRAGAALVMAPRAASVTPSRRLPPESSGEGEQASPRSASFRSRGA